MSFTELNSLILERKDLNAKIQSNLEILTNLGVGLDQRLTDKQGFPLENVDLYSVRAIRGETNVMINDFKAITGKIEKLLPTVMMNSSQTVLENNKNGNQMTTTSSPPRPPFVRVNSITPNSLAHQAGLLPGDLISAFGNLTKENFKGVQDFPLQITSLKMAKEKSLKISIYRAGLTCDLSIPFSEGDDGHQQQPQPSLGFHLVPLS